jgi:16S rRNA (adenine1518-N6/adenine1519-N6)-dimethyltransferase
MNSLANLLSEKGIHPSRKLGQNFLVHTESAEKIVRWANLPPGTRILEIGPGLGALTEALRKAGCSVTAIEKDGRLVEILRERWGEEPWLHLIHGDVLETDLEAIFREEREKISVVANLPYSISTPILERLLGLAKQLREMVLLFQEEVVDRLCANVGTKDYGRVTIWVRTLCEIERGPRIPKGSFHPAPDVESRLVRLVPLPEPRVPAKDLPGFQRFVALLFQHRRKSIRNGMKDSGFEVGTIDGALRTTGIDPGERAEKLGIEDLYRLSAAIAASS